MTIDDERGRYATKRDRLARLARLVAILQAHPEGMRTEDIATRVGDVRAHRLSRPDCARGGAPPAGLGRGRRVGDRFGEGVPAAAQADPAGGDGRRPVRAADGPLRGQVRPGPGGRLREARAGPAAAARRARRADARRAVQGAARRALQRQRPAPDAGLGGAPRRHDRLRAGALRGRRDAAPRDGPAVPPRAVAPDPRAVPDRLRRGARALCGRSRSSGSGAPR